MARGACAVAGCLAVFAAFGCAPGPDAESSTPDPAPSAPEQRAVSARPSEDPAASARTAPPTPPSTAGNYADLVDTTWRAGAYTFLFLPGGNVIVKGGDFDALSPSGVPGRASVENGILEIVIGDHTNTGTWDGANLVIETERAEHVDEAVPR